MENKYMWTLVTPDFWVYRDVSDQIIYYTGYVRRNKDSGNFKWSVVGVGSGEVGDYNQAVYVVESLVHNPLVKTLDITNIDMTLLSDNLIKENIAEMLLVLSGKDAKKFLQELMKATKKRIKKEKKDERHDN